MRAAIARFKRISNVPAMLAFALLAFQIAIPWSTRYYLTQDGPSHLYTAVVARDLLRADSPYASVYMYHPDMVSNWGTTVLFNASLLVFGPMFAERAIATLCILLGFFGIAYLIRSLDPAAPPWTPMINFLTNTWFLWIGFYNFYLGMVLCPFVVGYYIRHSRSMTWRQVAIVSGSLVLLFFTHVLPVGLSVMAICLLGLWMHVLSPLIARQSLGPSIRPVGALVVVVAPATLLCLSFLQTWNPDQIYDPALEWAWSSFPMHVFASSRGRTGEQTLLIPALLFFIGTGILAMRWREWASARGAVAIAVVLCFALYLVVPNVGFGGDEIKIRLAWAFFLFGCPVAYSVSGMRKLRTPIGIYIACFLAFNLFHAMRHNVRRVRPAIHAYVSALDRIPPGATVVRIRYPSQDTRERFGFGTLALDPLMHVDSWVAAQRRFIVLSDYQALTRTFPVTVQPKISVDNTYQLWDIENEQSTSSTQTLKALLSGFPVPIDYLIVVGDGTPAREAELAKLLSELGATMNLVGTDPANKFVRVYARK
jgi:hypothetical protein